MAEKGFQNKTKLGGAPGTRLLLQIPGIYGVQPDPCDPRRFLHEFAAEVSTFSGHDRACGQSKAQRIRLILEIQHDLSGHRTSPDKGRLAGSEWSFFDDGAIDQRPSYFARLSENGAHR